MVCSYFISLIGPVIEIGSGIFTPTSVSSIWATDLFLFSILTSGCCSQISLVLNRLLSFHTGFLEGETDSEVLNAAVSKLEIDVSPYNCKINEGELNS